MDWRRTVQAVAAALGGGMVAGAVCASINPQNPVWIVAGWGGFLLVLCVKDWERKKQG